MVELTVIVTETETETETVIRSNDGTVSKEGTKIAVLIGMIGRGLLIHGERIILLAVLITTGLKVVRLSLRLALKMRQRLRQHFQDRQASREHPINEYLTSVLRSRLSESHRRHHRQRIRPSGTQDSM